MITCTEPIVSETGRYNVTETCKILGIHRDTLQKYTNSGYIKCGYRKSTCRKFYTGNEIVRFWKSQL